MAKNDTKNHAGGYGKPPPGSQFKKGQSGNPGGRPKGSGSLTAAIRAVGETIVGTEADGTPVTTWGALAKNLFVFASKGNLKAMELLLKVEIQRAKSEGQRANGELQYSDAEMHEAVELLRNMKNGVLEIGFDFDEKPPASFCAECGKALNEMIEAYEPGERPTEH